MSGNGSGQENAARPEGPAPLCGRCDEPMTFVSEFTFTEEDREQVEARDIPLDLVLGAWWLWRCFACDTATFNRKDGES